MFQRLGGRLPSTTSGQLKSHHKTHNSIPAQEAILEVNISEEVMKGHKIIIRASGDEHSKVTPKDEASCSSYHITISEETKSDQTVDEVEDAPPALEDGGQATIDELKEINLGTKDDPRPTFVSTLLTPEEEEEYIQVLSQYKDVFAWSYKEMPGLDPRIAVHRLAIKKGSRPVKQA